MTRIAVLEADILSEEFTRRFGSFPEMFARLLAEPAPALQLTPVPVVEGQALPAPEDFDGYIISGSRHGAYDGHAWIARLEDFVRKTAAAGRPQVGICFGHQVMAQAFGGRVERSPRGWHAGIETYRISETVARPEAGQRLRVPVLHADEVVAPPPAARVIAESDTCRYAGFLYEAPALSFQCHPEFDPAFLAALLDPDQGLGLPTEAASAGRDSLVGCRPDSARFGAWIADFLRGRDDRTVGR